MTNFNDFLNEQLSDTEFKKEYDALRPEFEAIQANIDAKEPSGMMLKDNESAL